MEHGLTNVLKTCFSLFVNTHTHTHTSSDMLQPVVNNSFFCPKFDKHRQNSCIFRSN